MKKLFILLTVTCLMLSLFAGSIWVNAQEPGYKLSFEGGLGEQLKPENAGIDVMAHSGSKQAAKFNMYNIAWAGRYGATAFLFTGLNIEVGAEKNRYVVFEAAVDELAAKNCFDNLASLYLPAGGDWAPTGASVDSLSSLHNATALEFQYIIIDLGWNADAVVDTLRFDVRASSLETSADPTNDNAYNCGFLYLRSAAFFDTLDDAKTYVDPSYVPTPDDTTNPETGDTGFFAGIMLAMVATGVVIMAKKRQMM
ncbi:MAG: hypothetical protein E7385_03635 [Ruminococcaceae bacterium]|nr:hypothetical protein [Oscillospiraceae bacterium]